MDTRLGKEHDNMQALNKLLTVAAIVFLVALLLSPFWFPAVAGPLGISSQGVCLPR